MGQSFVLLNAFALDDNVGGVVGKHVIEVKLVQLANDRFPIEVTLCGIVIEVNPTQPLNKLFPIVDTPSGMSIDVKSRQLKNASSPIEVTPLGMSIDAKMAMTLGLVNTAAEMGEVSYKSTKIDFVFAVFTIL